MKKKKKLAREKIITRLMGILEDLGFWRYANPDELLEYVAELNEMAEESQTSLVYVDASINGVIKQFENTVEDYSTVDYEKARFAMEMFVDILFKAHKYKQEEFIVGALLPSVRNYLLEYRNKYHDER